MDAGMSILVTIGLIVIGIAGFVVMVIALSFRFFGWSFRTLTGGGKRRRSESPAHVERRVICPHKECGYANEPTAIYCGRCGRPLRGAYDVNA